MESLSISALRAALSTTRKVSRWAQAAERVLEEAALRSLSDEALQRLTSACYARSLTHRVRLFDWEQAWFARDLPPPPTRILLGGAGEGREMVALRARGYEVVAFEPLAARGTTLLRLDYQGLVRPQGAEQEAAVARIHQLAPYGAVLFGWGSFTHVPGAALRLAVLRAVHALSAGPLLLSVWQRPPSDPPPTDRARRLGAALVRHRGAALRAAREGDRVVAHAGYAHTFSQDELSTLAAEAGYRLEWFPEGYTHATLRPQSRI